MALLPDFEFTDHRTRHRDFQVGIIENNERSVPSKFQTEERAGVPKGVLNVVTALENTPQLGLALCESDIVKKN
jgi:hypothetical protein